MLLTISNEITKTDFEVAVEEEPILNLKLRIEESQKIEFKKQLILYNGKKIDDSGSTE